MSQYSEEGIIDVEERTKEVGKILNDPTLFPVEFLSWIKRFIEQSGIELPISSIIGGFKPGSGSLRNLAAGLIIPFGGPTAPQGSVSCAGQTLSRTEYGLLFAAIGTTWGAPNASTFSAPDLRDRTLFGAGAQLALAQTDGMGLGSRGPRHNHSVGQSPHSHVVGREVVTLQNDWQQPSGGYSIFGNMQTHDLGTDSATINISVGPGGGPTDTVAWAGINYVITTGQ